MRTTIDIPDALYRELKLRAAKEGISLKQLILRAAMTSFARPVRPGGENGLHFPVIRSKKPGSLKLGEEGVYEYIPFP